MRALSGGIVIKGFVFLETQFKFGQRDLHMRSRE